MKKSEEYLENNKYDIIDAIGNSFYNTVSYQIHEEIIKEIIKQAQIDAIDEAVKMCAENAKLAFADGYEIPDYCEEPFNCIKNEVGDTWYIKRESILQVADKLKIEL